MIKLSDLTRKQFMVCGVMMQESSNGIVVEIPEDPFIFINGPGRKQVSDPNGNLAKDGLYRWAADGSIQILKKGEKKYVALILKDSGAPSYGGHLTIASGLSDSYDDFFNPTRIALKEGTEEIAILMDGRHVIPVLTQEYEGLFWRVYNHQKSRLKKFGFDTINQLPMYAGSTLLTTANDKILEIRCGHRFVQHTGIINIDANTRGVDLLKVIETEIPEDKELSFLDCEDTKSGPLDREVILFDVDNIQIDDKGATMKISGASKIFKGGVSTPANFKKEYPLTPVTKTIFENTIFENV